MVVFSLGMAHVVHSSAYQAEADLLLVGPMRFGALPSATLPRACMHNRSALDTLWIGGLFEGMVSWALRLGPTRWLHGCLCVTASRDVVYQLGTRASGDSAGGSSPGGCRAPSPYRLAQTRYPSGTCCSVSSRWRCRCTKQPSRQRYILYG